jgi:hypothetical protein
MSYLRHLCLFAHRGIQHILCCVFVFICLRPVSYVPNVASFSGLSILDCLLRRTEHRFYVEIVADITTQNKARNDI